MDAPSPSVRIDIPAQHHSEHPLSPSSQPTPRRATSFTTASSVPGYFDNAHTSYKSLSSQPQRRQHASSVSSVRHHAKRASQADLLGVGPSRRPRSMIDSLPEDPADAASLGASSHSLKSTTRRRRSRSTGRASLLRYDNGDTSYALDGLSNEEKAVVEMRFDLMSDEELGIYLSTLFPLPPPPGFSTSSSSATSPSVPSENEDAVAPTTPATPATPRASNRKRLTQMPSEDDPSTPLFPPSPPAKHMHIQVDHPLRILARAVLELRDSVERLQEENEGLRAQFELAQPRKSRDKAADEASIHDGLTEALSTSLTTPSAFPAATNSLQPTISRTSHYDPVPRPLSPASSVSVPFPVSPVLPSSASAYEGKLSTTSSVAPRRVADNANRSSWTSGLWVWNKKARRKGSVGSLASLASGMPGPSSLAQVRDHSDEDEDEAWRKGDGDSPPSFKAIFLATRIITPDPSSILVSSSTAPNSLVAYLAHSLVSNARDVGITIRETVRRNSRSRATSVVSAESPFNKSSGSDTPAKDAKAAYGYGDTALAMGKSLLSSVSGATLRGSKTTTAEEHHRPSLLSRVSSSRPFPTTAVSPPMAEHRVGSAMVSPTDETPPPSVELASIVPDEARPPTVLLSRQNLGNFFLSTHKAKLSTATRFRSDAPPLTDRYGFIYDIQHAGMLKDASAAGTPAPASLTGTLPVPSIQRPERDEGEGWIEKRKKSLDQAKALDSPRRSFDSGRSNSKDSVDRLGALPRANTPDSMTPPLSRDDQGPTVSTSAASAPSTGTVTRHRDRASSVVPGLSGLNPSPAKPVTGKDHLTVSARGASSLVPSISAPPTTATTTTSTTAASPLSASLARMPEPDAVGEAKASRATVSSLLDQLTEIHDRQQSDRKLEWDAFLRKRQKAVAEGKKAKGKAGAQGHGHAHGQGLGTGEEEGGWGSGVVGLIGFAQLGRSGKEEERRIFGRLVRGGIPLAYRSDIWAECSGAKDLFVPGEYMEKLEKHSDEDSPVAKEIEKDVGRTFPGNVFFGGDGPGVAKLRRVLVAYSWHNPSVGYCQGMNMLAATLLLTHTDEEQAYWTLLAIVEQLLPPTFFSPTLLASRATQAVLAELVQQLLPKVHDKLAELGVDLASVTFGWFLSLFTDCLPVETLFRVWDVFFAEGRDVLFRVALSILKLNEPDVLGAEGVGDLFAVVGGMTSRLWTADKLITMQHGYKTLVRHKDVEGRFERHLRELQEAEGG